MVDDGAHNLEAEMIPVTGVPSGKLPLEQRVAAFAEQEDAWRKYNGGCLISGDIDATLKLLQENVKPADPDLQTKVMISLEKYLQPGQKIADVWMQKIAEGANYIGIINGEFGFYRGEEKLETPNVPLEFPVAPRVMRFREVEKEGIRTAAKEARQKIIDEMNNKDKNNLQDNDNIYS
jgi:hypothetical protein